MKISSSLLTEFAKQINGPEREDSRSTYYGVAHYEGNQLYVKIDGSETYLPVSNTVYAYEGDRVSVSVSGRSAVVTGNVSSPSPSYRQLSEVAEDTSNRAVVKLRDETTGEIVSTVDSAKTWLMADYDSKFNRIGGYIREDEDSGTIELGREDSGIKLVLTSDAIEFYKSGDTTPFGSWDGTNFHTGNIFIDLSKRAQFGSFAFVPRSDGSLSFLKVGDVVDSE